MIWWRKFEANPVLRLLLGHCMLLSAKFIVRIREQKVELKTLKMLNFGSEGDVCNVGAKGDADD